MSRRNSQRATRGFARLVVLLFVIAFFQACDGKESNTVEVVEYEGTLLTADMNAEWKWEEEDGAVILTTHGPDSTLRHRLLLIDSGTTLPIFGGFSSNSHLGDRRYTMKDGVLAIQSFNRDGEVSGEITGQLWKGPTWIGAKVSSVFWVDLSDSTSAK